MIFYLQFILPGLMFGFILDYVLGDPKWLPHPVRLIGKTIEKGENFFRSKFPDTEKGQYKAGVIVSLITVLLSFLVPLLILFLCNMLTPYLLVKTGWQINVAGIVNAIMCYQIIAAKSLKVESTKVYDKLVKGTIEDARKELSMIVGRDTEFLNRDQIARATVETVAENTSDGVIAPMFFMMIGGAPLGFAYKAINTLDSMIGYKNDKYINFGRFAAKLDDIANFIPARIASFLMLFSALITRCSVKNAWKIFKRDRKKHPSPNAGNLEAIVAGALNIQLGGDSYYFGKLHKKPYIGDDIEEAQPKHIKMANNLMYMSALWMMMLAFFIGQIGARFI